MWATFALYGVGAERGLGAVSGLMYAGMHGTLVDECTTLLLQGHTQIHGCYRCECLGHLSVCNLLLVIALHSSLACLCELHFMNGALHGTVHWLPQTRLSADQLQGGWVSTVSPHVCLAFGRNHQPLMFAVVTTLVLTHFEDTAR